MVSDLWKNGIYCLKIYLEKFNLSNLILGGYILAVLHFVTQFSHVSRHPRVKNKKQNFFFDKTVLKMVSQICGKKINVSTKVLLEKKFKN